MEHVPSTMKWTPEHPSRKAGKATLLYVSHFCFEGKSVSDYLACVLGPVTPFYKVMGLNEACTSILSSPALPMCLQDYTRWMPRTPLLRLPVASQFLASKTT